MCAHWYPEGYVLPKSTDFPAGPHHPAYTRAWSGSSAPRPWYATEVQRGSSTSGVYLQGTRRSSHSSQTQSSSPVSTPQQLANIAGVADPGLVSGVDYFKIGDTVRVRRLNPASGAYSEWSYGQVIRPYLRQDLTSEQERAYIVSYIDPRNGERKESEFSCFCKEIAPLAEYRGIHPLVYAKVALYSSKEPITTWVPAYVIAMSDFGVDIQIVSENTRVAGVRSIVPHHSSVARFLKAAGHRVAGDGD